MSCLGHDFPGELCREHIVMPYGEPDVYPLLFSCGRAKPPCDGHPDRASARQLPCPNGIVSPGSVWYCSRIKPACAGHVNGTDHCKEINAQEQIVKWIRDIQGETSGWVEKLLKEREGSVVTQDGRVVKFDVPKEVDVHQDLSLIPGRSCLNPAVAALRLLHKHLPHALFLLHGNHDNYLILADVTTKAKLSPRQHLWEQSGLLIEHGHRLEARLLPSDMTKYIVDAALAGARLVNLDPFGVPPVIEDYNKSEAGGVIENQDGTVTGYNTARDEFNDRRTRDARKGWLDNVYDEPGKQWGGKKEALADWAAQQFQQKGYQKEVARVWLGRVMNKQRARPHIFVMGHTHKPMLAYVEIDWRTGASVTIKSCHAPDADGKHPMNPSGA